VSPVDIHSVGGQIGGRSIDLSHSGCIWPLTHSHVQSAIAGLARNAVAPKARMSTRAFMLAPTL